MSLMRCSSAPRACLGGMGEVLCSPMSKEGWLRTAELEGAEWKEATGGRQGGDLAGEEHRVGGDG